MCPMYIKTMDKIDPPKIHMLKVTLLGDGTLRGVRLGEVVRMGP